MNLITIKELSEFTKVKEKTLYGWASRGLVPCCKLNGLLRFDLDEVKDWIENSRMRPGGAQGLHPRPLGKKDIDRTVQTIIASAKQKRYNAPQRGNRTNHARKGGS